MGNSKSLPIFQCLQDWDGGDCLNQSNDNDDEDMVPLDSMSLEVGGDTARKEDFVEEWCDHASKRYTYREKVFFLFTLGKMI